MMTERSASKLACTPRSCRVDQRLVRETSESATRMVDARIEKWRRWCDERILPDVHTMYLRRYAYREVVEMPQASNLPVSYFWEYLVDTYATTQAVAVRRQAEARPDVITLGRMLVEMTADASKLTREFWVAMWGDDDPHETWIANRQKIRNKIFAGSAGIISTRRSPAEIWRTWKPSPDR